MADPLYRSVFYGRSFLMSANLYEALQTACAEVGLVYREVPADGRWYETDVIDDRRGRGDGRIKLFPDGEGGIVCNWKGDTQVFFVNHKQPLTDAEREAREQRRQAAIRQAREEETRQHTEAAHKAQALWKAAQAVSADHPYLLCKGVKPVSTLREIPHEAVIAILGYPPKSGGTPLTGRLLVAPVKVGDAITTVELIDETGCKSAIAGGLKASGYWAAQSLPSDDGAGQTLLIGEGVATMLSARSATGYLAIAALSVSNLEPVARWMRERYPAATVILLADLDKNSGQPHPRALTAAQAVEVRLAIPDFGANRPVKATDFNDLAAYQGMDAVRRAIEFATTVSSPIWPDPIPLPSTLLTVEPFDYDLLPHAFKAWIQDIVERMQCAPDYLAIGAMVALAAIVGRQIGIHPKRQDDWLVVPNLWGALIGRPGVLKTPALEKVLKPIKRFEVEAKNEFQLAQADAETHTAVREARKKHAHKKIFDAVRKAADPYEVARLELSAEKNGPVRRRYIVNDSSVEKLGELLNENPNGLLVFRDELLGLLATLEKQGQEGARQFYLEAWNGNGRFTYDRIGRGTIDIEACCISLLGSIQPGPLQKYLATTADDGLMQRFQLAVWPDPKPDWRNVDRWPDRMAKEAGFQVFDRLRALVPLAIGALPGEDGSIPALRFAPDAQEEFDTWRAGLEIRLRNDDLHPALEAVLAKYRSLIPALALLIHLADHPAGGPVSLLALTKACAWGEYLESHARRIYGARIDAHLISAAQLAEKIRSGDLPERFTLREVYRRHWRHLNHSQCAEAAIAVLIDHHWLRAEPESSGPSGGRPSVMYRVNPKVREV
jgi:putative DNA primase/helicase